MLRNSDLELLWKHHFVAFAAVRNFIIRYLESRCIFCDDKQWAEQWRKLKHESKSKYLQVKQILANNYSATNKSTVMENVEDVSFNISHYLDNINKSI